MITAERLANIKAKPHGPDVADLIAEIERFWGVLESTSHADVYCTHCGFEIGPQEGKVFLAATAGIPHSTIDDSSGTC